MGDSENYADRPLTVYLHPPKPKPGLTGLRAAHRQGAKPNESEQSSNASGKTVTGHSSARGWAHFGLGLVELVPIPLISGAAGAVDAGMYVQEGNYGDAALAAGSVIPGEKVFALLGKGVKYFKDAREAEQALKEAEELKKAEQEAKDGESIAKNKDEKQKPCKTCSPRPVVLHTGAKVMHDLDFALPGVLRVELARSYVSDMGYSGPLGRNRISPLDASLEKRDDGTLLYRMGTDRTVKFDRPAPNPGVTSRGNGFPNLFLSAGRRGGYLLKDDGLLSLFVKFKDGICRLTEIRDLNNNTLSFHREADGVLTRLDRSDGFSFLFENDGDGRRVAATLRAPTGETRLITRYLYDARGNLIEARNSYAKSRRYDYDEANRFLSYDDGVNERCDYVYDAAGRVCAVRTPGGRFDHTIAYEEGQRAATLAYTARADARTRYTFDEQGMTLTETNGLGHVRRYERNAIGTLLAEVDGEGHRTAYSYDAFGNVRCVTDPEGRRTTYHYNADGQLEKLIDAAGHTWAWEYDRHGNLVATTDALGYRTDIVCDAAGQPTAIMRHDGLIEHRVYDAQHNLVRLVDYRGGVTRYERDSFGRIVAATDPLGHVTRYAYAETPGADFWAVTSMTRPDGVVVSREIAPHLAAVTDIDGEGNASIRRWGPFNLLREMEDPSGGKLVFSYDHQERLVSVVNQLGRRWTFDRDAAGRIVREEDFDGSVTAYSFDRADRLKERRYEDGSRLASVYNFAGNVTQLEAWEPGAREPELTKYWYDQRGLLAGGENTAARVAFERDSNGRIIVETNNDCRISSTYDCCGNRLSRQIGDHFVENSYDPLGAIRNMSIIGHATLSFTRDLAGREISRENRLGFRVDQSWDAVGQLRLQRTPLANPNDADDLQEMAGLLRSYSWTQNLMPKTIQDTRWGDTEYSYNDNSLVTEARHGDGKMERFTYNRALNVVASGD